MGRETEIEEGTPVTFVIPFHGKDTVMEGVVQQKLSAQFTIETEGGQVFFRFYSDRDWKVRGE